ncbi:AAA family ATPase [Treponema sp.]|uniref:AAA family ATPase n=1 Tax=Treponema sp. TaxID=166 RepID=UPI00298E4BBE|nr:AAA family ATPase [Treponema sp.]MCQ2241922.1 AAA family ATPase [Treponema sp.]
MELSQELRSVLEQAEDVVFERGLEYATPELVLFCMLDSSVIYHFSINPDINLPALEKEVLEYLEEYNPTDKRKYGDGDEVPHSVLFDEVFDKAEAIARKEKSGEITLYHYLFSMVSDSRLHASYLMKKHGINMEFLVAARQFERDHPEFFDLSKMNFEQMAEEAAATIEKSSPDSLSAYATNLTDQARKGKLDKLVGRNEEIERTIEILCRRTKNNPLHVGDAGVGKTSITEGLAQRIAEGNVPDYLKDAEIYSVEMSSLVAGTKFRGDFEKRIKKLVEELQKKPKAILFIDEIHTMIGAGTGSNSSGNLDAANILKPALSKGNLRCIGSTTFEEYTRIFEKDRALARRFQKIDILEPTRDECLKILKGILPKYEEYHQVKYSPECIAQAVDLSVRFFNDKRLPDKAIDVIDESGVYSRLHGKSRVTVNEIRHVVSRAAKVPLENISGKEKENLKGFDKKIKAEIFGQDAAVDLVCASVKKARAGFRNLEKPEASFLFVGPTGVGKTELAKVLAQKLGIKLLRFDMSEYQESYSISRLIGSAPGYVGYENGGVLTEAVRKENHAIILFDEIEKAHRDIYNTLLQVLDYGTLTDSQGRKADFRNCLIIFTSNCGASDMGKNSVGFSGSGDRLTNDRFVLKDAVDRTFTPEFRNRLDRIVYFDRLGKENAVRIACKSVDAIAKRLEAKKVKLIVGPEAYDFIAEQGMSDEFGARNIQRYAEDKIASPLINELLFGSLTNGGKVEIVVENGEIKCQVIS